MANKPRKVWKVVSRKVNSGKQTWLRKIKLINCLLRVILSLTLVFFFFCYNYVDLKTIQ
jgi:hypothetical protein